MVNTARLHTGSQIRFKTMMLKSSLYDYSNANILFSRTITITGAGADDATKQTDKRYKEVIIKNWARFIECTNEINNNQINHAKDLDSVMLMYDLIEYSDDYSKASGGLL